MITVREHLGLQRQKGATGINQVDAGQVVLTGNLLGAQVFFDSHGKIGAALDCGVVGDDHHLRAVHHANARDDASGGRGIVIHVIRRQR